MSRSNGNQAMQFGQLTDYNKRNIFLQNYAENKARRLVTSSRPFFKENFEIKNKWAAV